MEQFIKGKYKLEQFIYDDFNYRVFEALEYQKNKKVFLAVFKKKVTGYNQNDVFWFQSELKTLSSFKHPNISKVSDFGIDNEFLFFVTEYGQERPLSFFLAGKELKLSFNQVLLIVENSARGLSALHNRGILHGGINTDRVWINPAVPSLDVKLFGASLYPFTDLSDIEKWDDILRIPAYFSPEAGGMVNHTLNETSDLYSLGVLFYLLVTGELPFKDYSVERLLHKHVADSLAPPISINSALPGEIDRMICRLLAKDRGERYQRASEFLSDLQSMIQNPRVLQDHRNMVNFSTGLVGREDELETLKKACYDTCDKYGRFILIRGESGSGKTRLVEEVCSIGEEVNACFIRIKCSQEKIQTPFQIIHDTIYQFYQYYTALPGKEQKEIKGRIKKRINGLGAVLIPLNSIMKLLIDDPVPVVSLDPEKEAFRTYDTAARFLCAPGIPERPLILFLDDLQWVDWGSLKILLNLLPMLKKSNLLIIGTVRKEEAEPGQPVASLIEHSRVQVLDLDNFDREGTHLFLSEILGKEEIPLELKDFIFKRGRGNPLFTIQIVKYLYGESVIRPEGSVLSVDFGRLHEVNIPATVSDVIFKRIKFLSQEQKEVIGFGAFIGPLFSIGLLLQLTCISREELNIILDHLISLQLVEFSRQNGDNIQFTHDRIREAFCTFLNPEKKRKIHQAIARNMELKRFYDNTVVFYVANHYILGEDDEKSLEYAIHAGDMALEKYAGREAILYYKVARSVLERQRRKGSFQWIKVMENLSNLYQEEGDSSRGVKLLYLILSHVSDLFHRAVLYYRISLVYYKAGDYHRCEKYGQIGLKILKEKMPSSGFWVPPGLVLQLGIHFFPRLIPVARGKRKDAELIFKIYRVLQLSFMKSDLSRALWIATRSLNLCRGRIGKSRSLARSLEGYGVVCMEIPLFFHAMKYLKASYYMKKEMKDEAGLAVTLRDMGYCFEWQGDFVKALSRFRKSAFHFRHMGDIEEFCISLMGVMSSSLYRSDYSVCRKALLLFLDNCKDDFSFSGMGPYFKARLALEQGMLDRGEKILRRGAVLARQSGTSDVMFLNHLLLGEILVEKGRYSRAVKNIQKANRLQKSSRFGPHYVAPLYYILPDAYIEKFRETRNMTRKYRKRELARIRQLVVTGLKKCEPWIVHYGSALRVAGKFYALEGKHRKSRRCFEKSIKILEKLGRSYELGKSFFEFGLIFLGNSKMEKGRFWLDKAYNIFLETGSVNYLDKLNHLLKVRSEESVFLQRFKDKRKLSSIIKISQEISSILDIRKLLEQIIKEAVFITGATSGAVYMLSGETSLLERRVLWTENRIDYDKPDPDFRKEIVNRVFKSGRLFMSHDLDSSQDLSFQGQINSYNIKSVLCGPVRLHGISIGVFYLENNLSSSVFTGNDVELLTVFLSQAAISMENASLYSDLEKKVEERTGQLQQTLKELEYSNKELEHFAYVISHDLKEPLRMISGFVKLLQKRYKGKLDENADEYIHFAVDGSERMSMMIDGLLEYSRVGRRDKPPEPVDLEEVLDMVLMHLGFKIEEQKAEVIRGPMPRVLGHSLFLLQLFQNLISNGLKFSDGEHPCVEISAREEGDRWRFEVKDNGIGIASEDKEKIFQIFKRVNVSERYPGTGIGLAVCRKIVETHGGELGVDSEPGKGAVFHFSLPGIPE